MNYKEYKEAMANARQEDSDRRYERGVAAIKKVVEARDPKITTQDRVVLKEGDAAFNYYDMKPGVIGSIDIYPQPNTMAGQNSSTPMEEWNNYWFRFDHSDDGSYTSLDGSRICSVEFATRKGWIK